MTAVLSTAEFLEASSYQAIGSVLTSMVFTGVFSIMSGESNGGYGVLLPLEVGNDPALPKGARASTCYTLPLPWAGCALLYQTGDPPALILFINHFFL